VPRAKLSNWTTWDIRTAKKVRDHYPPECLNKIIGLLGSMAIQKKNEIRNRILDIVDQLHFELHLQGIPTTAQQRKGLELLCKGLNTTLGRLSKIDPKSESRIEAVADRDPQANNEDRYSGGRERLRQATRVMEALRRWTTAALDELDAKLEAQPATKLKKRGYPAEKAAIKELRKLWRLRKRVVSVNVAPLHIFVEAALRPVLKANGRRANLKALVSVI
jgi:hypothetical protein